MQRQIIIKGRSLGSTSDLTLLAPIKPGFVESLESVTHKTRIKRVLDTLHGARMASHEHAAGRLLSDSVERVGAIHSVRVAVLEPEDKVLLAVTFDGSWQSYIRVLWEKVGTLLDLIFCGTQDYVLSTGSFEAWQAWAGRVQVETGFFYGAADSSARDALYGRRVERMRQRGVAGTEAGLRAVLPSAELAVDRLVNPPGTAADDDPPVAYVGAPRMVRERVRSGLQGLAVLYRLTDLHRPGTEDGEVLRRAAADLLLEFVRMRDFGLIDEELSEMRGHFGRQMDWLSGSRATGRRPPPALPSADPLTPQLQADVQGGILASYERVTHGVLVLVAFDTPAVAAALLRWATDGAHGVTRAAPAHVVRAGETVRNIALTAAGLRALGLDDDALEMFPEALRQGMAARAGLLGDVRNNHPGRWRLPARWAPAGQPDGETLASLDGVHAVLQWRTLQEPGGALPPQSPQDHRLADCTVLTAELDALLADNPGLQIVAVEPMRRRYREQPAAVAASATAKPSGKGKGKAKAKAATDTVITEHFGFADGDGQPEWQPRPAGEPQFMRNRINLGEVLLGHPNAADPTPAALDPTAPQFEPERHRLLSNGSLVALRKYRQFPQRLHQAVAATATAMQKVFGGTVEQQADVVLAKLMGRYVDGRPLVAAKPGRPNDFVYDLDPQGRQCPLQAHVRRVHPRLPRGVAVRQPRLMRRSMSYGPAFDPAAPDDDDRGLFFIAYNADLGEQFETVQRWIAGGNSTGASSGQSCPILGVPDNGAPRHFSFEHSQGEGPRKKHGVFSVQLEVAVPLFDQPPVATQLEWGLYLFAPSVTALRALAACAAQTEQTEQTALAAQTADAAAPSPVPAPWQLPRGRALIHQLQQLAQQACPHAAVDGWKAVIEDAESIDRLDAAAVWAAIRADHGGVLRTPYGVLVADRALLHQVLGDRSGRYSVCGHRQRMAKSFGEIALGLDEGTDYRDAADPVNRAIGQLDVDATYALAFGAAKARIDAVVQQANEQALRVEDPRFEVGLDARDVVDDVLGALCDEWFGLSDLPGSAGASAGAGAGAGNAGAGSAKPLLQRGGADWAWTEADPPLYPGHFTALSRYMFQPNPGPVPVELGQRHGRALQAAMLAFVQAHRAAGSLPRAVGVDGQVKAHPALVAQAVFEHPTRADDAGFVASTLVGVLMGFNPTIIGAVLNVLREWHTEGRLAQLRARLRAEVPGGRMPTLAQARAALQAPMDSAAQMRPMPQIAWRTATEPHRLGQAGPHGVAVVDGDILVLGLVSGTQQSLADGQPDGRLMFGGVRQDNGGPTHACPGYHQGMAAMLGTLGALLTVPQMLRPGPAALSFVLEGDASEPPSDPPQAPQPVPSAALQAAQQAAAAAAFKARLEATVARLLQLPLRAGKRGLVLAWGDSWLDHSHKGAPIGTDLRDWLELFGYRVPDLFCKYSRWLKVQTLAADPQPFCEYLEGALMAPEQPQAILLSGGGNDSTQDALRDILLHHQKDIIDTRKLDDHIRELKRHYSGILDSIATVLGDNGALKVPVVVHGYDRPIPAGRSMFGGKYAPKWLRTPFANAGHPWDDTVAEADAARQPTALAMAQLIDALNQMLAGLAHPRLAVRYVDLCGSIDPARFTHAVDGWVDDLHPAPGAFRTMAERIDRAIQASVKAAP